MLPSEHLKELISLDDPVSPAEMHMPGIEQLTAAPASLRNYVSRMRKKTASWNENELVEVLDILDFEASPMPSYMALDSIKVRAVLEDRADVVEALRKNML